MNGTWREELISEIDAPGESRGTFEIKQKGERLYALIGRRWCSVHRRADGKLAETFGRSLYEGIEGARS
jgi:hypothetical protein